MRLCGSSKAQSCSSFVLYAPRISGYLLLWSDSPSATRLSPGLDNSTGNSTVTRQLLDRIARQSLTATRQTSTATRQKPPDSMCLGVKASSSTARQLDRPRQTSTDQRQTSTEPSRYGPAYSNAPAISVPKGAAGMGEPFSLFVRFVRWCSF